jgi:GxxExxY protein
MVQEGRKGGRGFGDGTKEAISALIEVHRHLGPGLMESAYEACVCAELAERGIEFERQRALPMTYKGVRLERLSPDLSFEAPSCWSSKWSSVCSRS